MTRRCDCLGGHIRGCPNAATPIHMRRAGFGDVSLTAAAYLTPLIAKLDALAADLIATWHPTGFYTPDQIRAISGALVDAQKSITGPIDAYRAAYTPGKWIAEALETQVYTANGPIIRFVQAANTATQTGKKYVDAPGFRDAVVTAYSRLVLAAHGLRGLQSFDDWAFDAAVTIGRVFTAASAVIKKIGGIAATVIESSVNQVLHLPETLSMLWTAAKWAALAYGGWWAYQKGTAHRGGGG